MKKINLAGVAVVAMVSTGALPTSQVASESLPYSCPPGEIVNARVMHGADVAEPNAVTAAQAAAIDARMQQRLQRRADAANPARLTAETVTIDVRVHVIRRSNGSGNVSRSMIDQQIAVLNAAFSGQTSTAAADTPFRFSIRSIDRTSNSDWYNWSLNDDDDRRAKNALHRGGADDLNLYITGLQDGLLGYATFPGGELSRDGVVVLNKSLPGGSAAPYNEGDTATHEVGHWLGLFHTFQNGCSKPGDRVGDTPYQRAGDNVVECDTAADTCTGKAGLDPVQNFMNYSDDACMNQFTVGQSARMSKAWLAYRAPAA